MAGESPEDMRSTVRRLLPTVLIVVTLVAGCGPGQVAADQAAVVDGTAIPMDELTRLVEAGRSPGAPPQPTEAVAGARRALQSLIGARVVVRGAAGGGGGSAER